MPDYETFQHDVLIIGSGGAGLRAAIEASAAGDSVSMVCKCLLGKAHTVMAEGGIAAALANVDDRDNWKVHFADTKRGGQYVNNWRMAELHAKEAPSRVRELEAWGAVYDRTRGHFKVFHAKAVVLATGGIGKAYIITSNSWDCTGDGHSLAYHTGATLIDMEYVQFHPTGMVWPPSVAGMLVTEGVRGEGGILTNADGKRFMFDFIPDNYKAQTADNEEEGWRYTQGDKNARRPPELLTRDHVARCIVREIKEGRGTPHGGVYLDISWIKKRISNAEEHIKRKLPSMHHQFKTLGDIDITSQPMEVGPTTHYIMGGVHVDADTQMSDVAGLFAAGECAAGINGANRLGGNSLSDLVVFGKRAGEYAAKFAKENSHGTIDNEKIDIYAREALKPFENSRGENPYSVQRDLQETMQHNVGIVRNESEMLAELDHLRTYWERAAGVGVIGNRDFNPGWHTALDLKNLLTVSEAISRAALERKESRGAQFREDYPNKDDKFSKVNMIIRKTSDGTMEVRLEPLPEMPDYLKQVIEEMK